MQWKMVVVVAGDEVLIDAVRTVKGSDRGFRFLFPWHNRAINGTETERVERKFPEVDQLKASEQVSGTGVLLPFDDQSIKLGNWKMSSGGIGGALQRDTGVN